MGSTTRCTRFSCSLQARWPWWVTRFRISRSCALRIRSGVTGRARSRPRVSLKQASRQIALTNQGWPWVRFQTVSTASSVNSRPDSRACWASSVVTSSRVKSPNRIDLGHDVEG